MDKSSHQKERKRLTDRWTQRERERLAVRQRDGEREKAREREIYTQTAKQTVTESNRQTFICILGCFFVLFFWGGCIL